MREIIGNIWSFHQPLRGRWVVVTTNGFVKNNGCAVMGRGIAAQCAKLYPTMPAELGAKIRLAGNKVYAFPEHFLFTFPTKHVWWEAADPELIRVSCLRFNELLKAYPEIKEVYLPHPGCENGKLEWKDVKPILEETLTDDRIIVIEKGDL